MPRPRNSYRWAGWMLAWLAASTLAVASEYRGQVVFGETPVPGATVIATQGDKKIAVTTDEAGVYRFADLADGTWTIEVEMLCFAPLKQDVTIVPNAAAARWELKLLPLGQITAQATAPRLEPKLALTTPRPGTEKVAADAPPVELPAPPDDSGPRPADGLLINGSINNAATSQFTLAPAFGNTRSSKSLYTGGLSFTLDNSVFDARPYSVTGLVVPKKSYNDITGGLTFGGPLNIPHLMPRGPNLFVTYQWLHNRNQSEQPGLVPTAQDQAAINGKSDPAALYLLSFYPSTPNVVGDNYYNDQVAETANTHQDSVSLRLDRRIGRKDSVYGGFALQSTRSDAQNFFGFVDTTDLLGLNTNANWNHSFGHQIFNTLGYRYSRLRTHVIPYFESKQNVSGLAGIAATPIPGGNLQDATDWGPPTLLFATLTTLSDASAAFNRNQTGAVSDSVTYSHHRHNYTLGADFRRQEFNIFSQQNATGTYSFSNTGGTNSDFTDFLKGQPDTSAIAFGNPDKYLRQSVYDVFFTDDWRVRPELTLNLGIRWDYGSPITELKNRLVNLDVTPGFAGVAPVQATSAVGSLTGQQYPTSLIRPDKLGFEPRVGISWRPIPASTLIIRAGYGIYDDTSVYLPLVTPMTQQQPLSTSVADTYDKKKCPLTLEAGFLTNCASSPGYLFGVDPNFRVGYAQNWNLSAQRDLPGALVATVSYLGIKGTRGIQAYLPNSYPLGGKNPCPTCTSGFLYRSSNGNSTRESAQVQIRRRLRSGLTANAQYIFSKSIDDDSTLGGQGPVATGGAAQSQAATIVAQNWQNLSGERSLSTFDQRHLFNAQLQYTSGMGKGGGTLTNGWRGRVLKEWTLLGTFVLGSGLPETPIYFVATPGTTVTGAIRASLTGQPIYGPPNGAFLNLAGYAAPANGQWGTAGRDSITGPGEFTFNGSAQRTFRLKDHFTLDFRLDATNLLNRVVFTSYNTVINDSNFGAPAAAASMRSIQTTIRVRY